MDKRMLGLFLVIGIGVLLWVVTMDARQQVRETPADHRSLASVEDNDTVTAVFDTGAQNLTLELVAAVSPGSRREGLMNRSVVPLDGMLFVFPSAAPQIFWMKHTQIPLDMVFVSADNRIVTIHQADPEPGTSLQELTRYRSTEPAQYVIETAQGVMERNDIAVGDTVHFAAQ